MGTQSVELSTLLVSKAGYRQGRPCLRGTGITVHNVAGYYRAGHTTEEFCADNPDLDPSLFFAAVAYYLANREQIDAELDADIELEKQLAAESPHRWDPKAEVEPPQ
ncbi:MAG: DUF433 domain-containing protein [Dehalococcoidia bacterium]